jgi:hypothetical protein
VHGWVHQDIFSVSRPGYLDSESESLDRQGCFRAAHWKSKIWQGPTEGQGGRPCKKASLQSEDSDLTDTAPENCCCRVHGSLCPGDCKRVETIHGTMCPYFCPARVSVWFLTLFLPDSTMIGTWTSLQVRIGGNFRCIRERSPDVLYCCLVTALLSCHSASLPHHMRCC